MMRFLGIEAAGGILLIVASMVALFWANSPWSASYHALWDTEIEMAIGDLVALEHDGHPFTLGQFVNDVLMVIFFFVVGLEIKRELVTGELRRFRAALLPALAALGGMVVPALVYLVFAGGGDGSAGWGIPMATDIAFAIGVVSLLGNRVPTPLKVFLLTLAIVDDIGAILVIALFYTSSLEPGWLFLGGVAIIGVVAMARAKIRYAPLYVGLGVILWYSVLMSGVHTTIAGVIMGLLAPAVPLLEHKHASEAVGPVIAGEGDATTVKVARFHLSETVPVTERLENLLHPVSGFFILPVFALANAGVEISGDSVANAVSSGISVGVVVGLVVGKLLGVSAFTLVAVRLGLCSLPAGATTRHVLGISAMAGIGFTVSMFITGLAFDSPGLQDEAKIGILVASAAAALIGTAILYGARSTVSPPAGGGSD
ncbi:MAG: Na(+)/H(+) antiporter NhaA [Acidimicrobiaceae bacterium]|nr:Na(+)/H(+) antiporter NhaA [Acidimicrobiaceae bacterium]